MIAKLANLRKSTLDKLLEEIVDYRGKTPKKLGSKWFDKGVQTLSAKNIKEGRIVRRDTIRYVDEKLYKKWMKTVLREADILLTSEAPLGETYLVKSGDLPLCLSQRLFGLRPNRKVISPYFLYYYLISPRGQAELDKRGTGATVKGIRQSALREVEVSFPKELETQEKIGRSLYAYDLLIENTIRRVQLLENAAQAIYNEWFVKCRFPGYEKTSFVDSKTNFGKIPVSWRVGKLEDISNITMGQSPSSDNYNEQGNGLPFHQGVTNYGFRFPITQIYSKSGVRQAKENDILFSVRAPVGRINVADQKMIIGRGLAAIRDKTDHQSFLLYLLKHHFSSEDIIGGGAIFNSVTKKDLRSFPIVIPALEVIASYDRRMRSADSLIKNLTNQLERLREARDLLIPKLMNVEIKV